jgi:hypothetical protein
VLYVTKGVRFKIMLGTEEKELIWAGLRAQVSFVLPAVGEGGTLTRTPTLTLTLTQVSFVLPAVGEGGTPPG